MVRQIMLQFLTFRKVIKAKYLLHWFYRTETFNFNWTCQQLWEKVWVWKLMLLCKKN